MKVITVFGTRPEAIKMAPVIRALDARADRVQQRICVTAQHRHMLDQVLGFFSIRPHYDLDVMTAGQMPMDVCARVTRRLLPVFDAERPDWVLVQGDTTTTMAAALAASYHGVRVGHIEAGLRTFDRTQPFPEEINRTVVTAVADLHFAPTALARENLLREGVVAERVFVTGNPGIDALFHTLATLDGGLEADPLAGLPEGSDIVLVTAHRRESFGRPLEEICHAVREIADAYRGRVQLVYPVHPNRNVSDTAHRILGGARHVRLLEPLDYRTLVHILRQCDLVLTDSGGIQEEAPSLGRPALVLRELTERPEGVHAGVARLVGTDRARIVEETRRILDNPNLHTAMSRPANVYGDGGASPRIVSALLGEALEEMLPDTKGVHTGAHGPGGRMA
jgi:UDP-N-acetylglucosamine 2-epimerase (non-hydrolysing)